MANTCHKFQLNANNVCVCANVDSDLNNKYWQVECSLLGEFSVFFPLKMLPIQKIGYFSTVCAFYYTKYIDVFKLAP